jgi:ATP-dependent Lhr-like helicase
MTDTLKPKDHAEAVAHFRAQLLGPLLVGDLDRGALRAGLAELSQKRVRPPGSALSRRYSKPTLERWYYRYKKGGVDFSSPQYYRVFGEGGRELGYLEQQFVDTLVEEMTSFLLGGRAWLVRQVSHSQRSVTVVPAPRGKKPSWGGFAPKLLGFELCRRIRRLLVEDTQHAYLSETARDTLAGYREDFGDLLRSGGAAIQLEEANARWWTFAGGRINHTLKYALAETSGWKIISDNWQLRIEGDGISRARVGEAIDAITGADFWEADDTWQRILAKVPPYRLSKFQPALPPRFQQEMLGRYLLDANGARRFVEALG